MNTFAPRNLIAAATVSIIAGFAFTATPSSAATYDNLNKCHFATKEKVIKCCETLIRRKGAPRWFIESNSTCNAVAVCKRGRPSLAATHVVKPRCYIQRRDKAPRSDSAPVRDEPRQREDNNPTFGGGKD